MIPFTRRKCALWLALALVWMSFALLSTAATAQPAFWKMEWKKTDFSKTSVDFKEIMSGGPPKDGIPSIDKPKFIALADVTNLADTEPVIGVSIAGDNRAYPIRILIWHEIVNDVLGGKPISVTFCPLCNAAMVFDRVVEGRTLDFGTTGKLRNSDLVMYDRQTESWWQQFTGTAIVGEMLGKRLKLVPARLESFANFKARFKTAKVLVPNRKGMRRYGMNPYAGYDSSSSPFLYRGASPKNIAPLARVVTVEGKAWALDLIRKKGRVAADGGLVITWQAGQNSALDTAEISSGADVGNVVVQRESGGKMVDVAYGVDFAFAFHAFYPNSRIVTE